MSTTPESILETVRRARSSGETLCIRGGDTKRHIGPKPTGDADLHVDGLDHLVSYEPGELILVTRPGMRLSAVESLLAAENQHLPFEPPHWGEAATLGGTVACNLSGPRRFKAGASRDFVLGIEMVDGHGQLIRAGGRVVKNVTGYDLSKLLSGSFGTLGVLTELCIKVWPRPETERTLVWHGQACGEAIDRMLDLAAAPCEVTALAYLAGAATSQSRILARLEGSAPAVAVQEKTLLSRCCGETEALAGSSSAAAWNNIRELKVLKRNPGQQLWRMSHPAVAAKALVEGLRPHGLEDFALDWGGALLWALFPAQTGAAELHDEAARHQATAWRLASGPEDDNKMAFSPLSPGLARLNLTVKQAFDPLGLFNPGRLPTR